MTNEEYYYWLENKRKELCIKLSKSEAHLEDFFRVRVGDAGGLTLKFLSPSMNGLPDRIIFYKGRTWLVELKTLQGKLQANQKACHNIFAKHEFEVKIIRTKQQVLEFIDEMISK